MNKQGKNMAVRGKKTSLTLFIVFTKIIIFFNSAVSLHHFLQTPLALAPFSLFLLYKLRRCFS